MKFTHQRNSIKSISKEQYFDSFLQHNTIIRLIAEPQTL